MRTSQVSRCSTYSARTAWEFAKLPFRLRETALLAALIDLSQETPSDPAPPGHLPQGGEASPASKEHKVRQRARAKRALGGKGVLVPSGHQDRPSRQARRGWTSQVSRRSTYSARIAWEFAKLPFRLRETALLAAGILYVAGLGGKIPSQRAFRDFMWAAVSEVPLVKPGGAWYNKIPGGEARPEIGGCKGLDGEGGPW